MKALMKVRVTKSHKGGLYSHTRCVKYQKYQKYMITLGTKWELYKTWSFGSKSKGDEFRYDSENMRHSEISQGLRNFRYGCEIFAILAKFLQCIAKILHSPASLLHSAQPPFLQFHLTFLQLGLMKSPRTRINQHRYEAKLEMMAEAHKTCKTTKNNLETISVVLNGPTHVNRLNSYD